MKSANGDRILVAIAGPPASGKSTLARDLAKDLNEKRPGCAAVVQMDGFHFDNGVLSQLNLAHRKGAPETFDVIGLQETLVRLKHREDPFVAVPKFDRSLDLSRGCAELVYQSAEILLVEGNYLMLDQEPWRTLYKMFDVTIFLQMNESIIRSRLKQRWEGQRYSAKEQDTKIRENDLPNAKLVNAVSHEPDILFSRTTKK